jgi:hypothetical protein
MPTSYDFQTSDMRTQYLIVNTFLMYFQLFHRKITHYAKHNLSIIITLNHFYYHWHILASIPFTQFERKLYYYFWQIKINWYYVTICI